MLQAAALRGDAGVSELRGAIEEGIELIDDEIGNLSSLIAELRPAALDELGLVPALRTLAERKGREGGLEIAVLARLDDPDGGRLPRATEDTIYRLVQEALTNVAKHGRASRAEAVLERADGVIEVTVSDDGLGFEPARVERGYGLIGMRERVGLAGGTLRIDAAAGRGTTVRATIPLPPAGDQGSSSPRSST